MDLFIKMYYVIYIMFEPFKNTPFRSFSCLLAPKPVTDQIDMHPFTHTYGTIYWPRRHS